MPTNDFLPFATGGSANVEAQAAYASDTLRTNGNQPGVAISALNNKAIRQSSYVTSLLAQFVSNQTGTDTLDDTVSAKFLAQLNAAVVSLSPVATKLTSGSGTYNLPYVFFIATGNATVGATYTTNGVTYTVLSTISAGLQLQATGSGAPTASGTLTKASGTGDTTLTFYAVRAAKTLRIRMVGGGGGGAGGGGTNVVGGSGTATLFGSSLLAAGGGNGGSSASNALGGAGGTASLGSGPTGLTFSGAGGGTGGIAGSSGGGGASFFGGTGLPAPNAGSGTAPATNSGSGGAGGAASVASANSAGGGAAGGYVDAVIASPAATYAYTVGAGGAGGISITTGVAGAAGIIFVEALF